MAYYIYKRVKNTNWDGSYTMSVNDGPHHHYCRHGVMQPVCKKCNKVLYLWRQIVYWYISPSENTK